MDAVYEGSWFKGDPKGTGKFIQLQTGIIQYGFFENGNWTLSQIDNK